MKKINRDNFFKNTYCLFDEVSLDQIDKLNLEYQSKSDSRYYYTDSGVFRYSDHWGRVANCRWTLNAEEGFKNQKYHLGYSDWDNFWPLNAIEKLFYLKVDFLNQKVTFFHKNHQDYNDEHLFSASEAQYRTQKIRELMKNTKWATYYGTDVTIVQESVITAFINSDIDLHKIKLNL